MHPVTSAAKKKNYRMSILYTSEGAREKLLRVGAI